MHAGFTFILTQYEMRWHIGLMAFGWGRTVIDLGSNDPWVELIGYPMNHCVNTEVKTVNAVTTNDEF
jgi:hypothetical protein